MKEEDNPYVSPKGMEFESSPCPWWKYIDWGGYCLSLALFCLFCLFFYPLLLFLFLYFDIKEKRPWAEIAWDFIYPLLLWIIVIMLISSVFWI